MIRQLDSASRIHLLLAEDTTISLASHTTTPEIARPDTHALVHFLAAQNFENETIKVDAFTEPQLLKALGEHKGAHYNSEESLRFAIRHGLELQTMYIPFGHGKLAMLQETLSTAEDYIAHKKFPTLSQIAALAGKLEVCIGNSLVLGPFELVPGHE